MIQRPNYLNKLIHKKENGKIKVITGIRRCGKSYLLTNIYKDYLLSYGVDEPHIIILSLEDSESYPYRNPLELDKYLKEKLVDDKMHYIILDEIQKVKSIKNPYLNDENEKIGFADVLLSLMKKPNVDLYVTGSNSVMLSSDILTEFRGRGDEIRVFPLSFKEVYDSLEDKTKAWRLYSTYGGMPDVVLFDDHAEKQQYLKTLFNKVYLTDIQDRHNLRNDETVLSDLLSCISSAIGSLTNPAKLANTFQSKEKVNVAPRTIARYLEIFENAYLIEEVQRYDIKGKNYIGSPLKYYFTDIGIRNAMLNFRQNEENHIMENIIYNELVMRGYSVDVGVVEYASKDENKKVVKTNLEVDFIVNNGDERYYIQSAFAIPDEEKRKQETFVYSRIPDSFKKIVIVKDDIEPWHDERGVYYIGLQEFLLNKDYLN